VAQGAGLEAPAIPVAAYDSRVAGWRRGEIRTLAERLALKHHSVVELIDRLETHGYVRRTRGREDRRRVFGLVAASRRTSVWKKWCGIGIGELRSNGHEFVRAIDQLLEKRPQTNQEKRSRSGTSVDNDEMAAKRGNT